MQKWKWWYIPYLLDLITSPTKFQINWTRTQIFQLKQFDIAVTLKYSQGNWKWCEQVKLSE